MDAIIETLARELGRTEEHINNVVTLIDEGATIPFIARYRKELHGSMDDQLIRTLADRLQYLRNLEARKSEIKAAVEAQGKLTDELAAAVDAAATLAEVEDLYRPYRPKRRTRASIAREKGLEPLAQMLLTGADEKGRRLSLPELEAAARAFADPENEALVQRAFERLSQGRTVIMIAHRLTTIKNAGRIFVLREGRVEESGTHDTLVAGGGLYAKMWQDYQTSISWKVGGTK